jgi:hypothetical protein
MYYLSKVSLDVLGFEIEARFSTVDEYLIELEKEGYMYQEY